jgi:hypothetical protein
MSGSLTPPPAAPARPAAPPPAKPPAPKAAAAPAPPPLERPSEDSLLDVEDPSLLEEGHYENEGENFAMKFGEDVEADGESTAIGSAPPRPSDGFGGVTMPDGSDTEDLPDPKKSIRTTNRNDDW